MWTSGKRAFALGSILLLLTALAHGLGTLSTPSSASFPVRALLRSMAAITGAEGMGLRATVYQVVADLSFFMSLACAAWGTQNLLLARVLEADSQPFRIMVWASFLFSLVSALMALGFGIAPPVITFGASAMCFLVTLRGLGSPR